MEIVIIEQYEESPNTYLVSVDGVEMYVSTGGKNPIEVVKNAFDAKKDDYKEARLQEYPSIQEQLDMIYHDFDGWKAKIKAIKDRHPK